MEDLDHIISLLKNENKIVVKSGGEISVFSSVPYKSNIFKNVFLKEELYYNNFKLPEENDKMLNELRNLLDAKN